MNLLIVGSGQGSWIMRGHQLGAELGARVTHDPKAADWTWADLAILIKRHGAKFAAEARVAGVAVVWDALDCWRQPAENRCSEDVARADLRCQIAAIAPRHVIGATEAQAAAAGGTYLPHHSWQGLTPDAPRATVSVVAYQGNASYLGAWGQTVSSACAARGWSFVVNPSDLRGADLIVALREGPWDGWVCRQWKSGVKLVNAVAAGKPVITQDTAAFREIAPPGTAIETAEDLGAAFDTWRPLPARVSAAEQCATMAPAYTVSAIASRYRTILEQVTSCTTR